MRIKMLKSIASADWNYRVKQIISVGSVFAPGEIPSETAEKWIASGTAVRVEEEQPVVETASVEVPEAAVTRRGRPSGRSNG